MTMLATAIHAANDAESVGVYVFAALIPVGLGFLIRQSVKGSKHSKVVSEFIMGKPEVKDAQGNIIQEGILPARAQMLSMSEAIGTLKVGQDAIAAHLTAQDQEVEVIKHEVETNDGSSVKDSIKRIEVKLDQHMKDAANEEVSA